VLSRDDNRRPQDRMDLVNLLKAASEDEILAARSALNTIQERGFNRGKNLASELASVLQTLR
jgi:hypothetical protein